MDGMAKDTDMNFSKLFDFYFSNLLISVFACVELDAAMRICHGDFPAREFSRYGFAMESRIRHPVMSCYFATDYSRNLYSYQSLLKHETVVWISVVTTYRRSLYVGALQDYFVAEVVEKALVLQWWW
jgi:hypothetical protein